jgi:hypothetical protein
MSREMSINNLHGEARMVKAWRKRHKAARLTCWGVVGKNAENQPPSGALFLAPFHRYISNHQARGPAMPVRSSKNSFATIIMRFNPTLQYE